MTARFAESSTKIGTLAGPKEPLIVDVPFRLDSRGVAEMTRALTRVHEANAAGIDESSVVVLASPDPERFCLGMDFEETTGGAVPTARDSDAPTDLPAHDDRGSSVRERLSRFATLMHSLATCPRPTLAVIDGGALGGGLGLAAACDYVLATDRSRIGLPEALYGLAPAIIRPALETRLSSARLRQLLFTGYSRDAAEAYRLGLFDEVVAPAELVIATKHAIRQLARARTSTVIVARRWAHGLETALRIGVEETAAALQDPDVIEALAEDMPWAR